MDPHNFLEIRIPQFFPNGDWDPDADPDPALQNCVVTSNFEKQMQILTISKHFSFFPFNFSLLYPNPGGKLNADPDPRPCFWLYQWRKLKDKTEQNEKV